MKRLVTTAGGRSRPPTASGVCWREGRPRGERAPVAPHGIQYRLGRRASATIARCFPRRAARRTVQARSSVPTRRATPPIAPTQLAPEPAQPAVAVLVTAPRHWRSPELRRERRRVGGVEERLVVGERHEHVLGAVTGAHAARRSGHALQATVGLCRRYGRAAGW